MLYATFFCKAHNHAMPYSSAVKFRIPFDCVTCAEFGIYVRLGNGTKLPLMVAQDGIYNVCLTSS